MTPQDDPTGRPAADPTRRFTSRVDDYVRSRPGYPDAILDVLREDVGLAPDHVVADLGAGTGLSAEPFLRAGHTVLGVEPNDAMRAAADARLASRPGWRAVAGSAEATGLEPASVDGVVAAQAFHWFDIEAARREALRILRPTTAGAGGPGWAALLWNTRRTDETPFLRAYEALLLEFGTDYQAVRHDRRQEARVRAFFGGPGRRRVLDNAQRLDLEGLRARLLSSSYTPGEGDPGRVPMLDRLDAIFREHAREGTVEIRYDLEVYSGRPSDEGAA